MRASFVTITAALAACSYAIPGLQQAPFTTYRSDSLSQQLQDGLTIEGLLRHSRKLQAIADENDGTRVFSSSGHNATLTYIAESALLNGYHTWLERRYHHLMMNDSMLIICFLAMHLNYTEKVKQEASVVSPIQIDIPMGLMTFTESTPLEGVRASLAHVPGHGCHVENYPKHVNGKIALVERGDCAFGQKAYAAGQAGAEALLIYNNEDGSLSGTLGQDFPAGAPTAGISKEDGDRLIRLLTGHNKIELRVAIVEKREERLSYNVIAETKV